MFKVYFTNFSYFSANEKESIEDAKKVARQAGFQSQIVDTTGKIVAIYCPLLGMRDVRY